MNKLAKRICTGVERFRLRGKRFAILSNNCWGYELYNALGREYNTPFVGLFLFPESYLALLENLETGLRSELAFTRVSRWVAGTPGYPVGVLGAGIEIHFLHYATEQEAREKWNRRTARLLRAMESGTPLFVKFCDRDGCSAEHLARFHALPFPHKLSLGIRAFGSPQHLCRPELKDPRGDFVADGVQLYDKRYHYFDIADWIARGRVRRSPSSRLLALIS